MRLRGWRLRAIAGWVVHGEWKSADDLVFKIEVWNGSLVVEGCPRVMSGSRHAELLKWVKSCG